MREINTSINCSIEPMEEQFMFTSSPYSLCKIKVMYSGLNRNDTYFSKQLIEKMFSDISYTPIVGNYSIEKGDFEGHGDEVFKNKDGKVQVVSSAMPLGVITEYPEVNWEQDEDGNEYITVTGLLWTKRYEAYLNDLMKGQAKKQSMEIFPDTVKGMWAKKIENDEEFFIYEEAKISAFCILGDDREPCFERSNIRLYELKQDKFKKEFNQMLYELKEYTKKEEGGKELEKAKKAVEKAKDTALQADIDEAKKLVEALDDEELKAELLAELDKIKVKNEDKKEEEYEADPEEDKADGDGEEDEVSENEILKEKEETIAQLEKEIANLTEQVGNFVEKINKYELKEKQEVLKKFEAVSKDLDINLDNYTAQELEKELSYIAFQKGLSINNFEVAKEGVFTYETKNSGGEAAKPAWIEAIEKKNI